MTDERADHGLRLLLRAKPHKLVNEMVCDAVLDLCCKQHTPTPSAASAFDSSMEDLAVDNMFVNAMADGTGDAAMDSAARSDGTDELAEYMLVMNLSQSGACRSTPAVTVGDTVPVSSAPQQPMVVNTRVARVVLLDALLWGSASPQVQRHWLQRLHGLLTEDDAGASNASCLIDAGLLDCVMCLLSSEMLVPGGNHLAGTRLVLRTWHSVQFSMDITRRIHGFLAAMATPRHADTQLLSLRMLSRMVEHAKQSLEELGKARHASSGSAQEASDLTEPMALHAGARAVLTVLQPALLFSFLVPDAQPSPRVVALVLRLIVSLLLLSHRFPAEVRQRAMCHLACRLLSCRGVLHLARGHRRTSLTTLIARARVSGALCEGPCRWSRYPATCCSPSHARIQPRCLPVSHVPCCRT